MSAWPHGDPAAIARDVLRADPYRAGSQTTTSAPESAPDETMRRLIEHGIDWIIDHLLRPVFHPINRLGSAIAPAGDALVIVGELAAGAVLLFSVVRLALALLARPDPISEAEESPAASSPDDWRAIARDAAARGQYALAIGALFRAGLLFLDERELIAFDAARTPGEYRRALRRSCAAAEPAFERLAASFVRATFAESRPDAAAVVNAERALGELEAVAVR